MNTTMHRKLLKYTTLRSLLGPGSNAQLTSHDVVHTYSVSTTQRIHALLITYTQGLAFVTIQVRRQEHTSHSINNLKKITPQQYNSSNLSKPPFAFLRPFLKVALVRRVQRKDGVDMQGALQHSDQEDVLLQLCSRDAHGRTILPDKRGDRHRQNMVIQFLLELLDSFELQG
jgi:hypothetical protein